MNFSEFSHGKFEMVFIVAWLSRLKYTSNGPTLCLTKCPFPWSLEEQGSTGVKWDSLQRFIAGYRRPIRPALARNGRNPQGGDLARTRRAYRLDVAHFLGTLAITTPAELRQADHKAVIAWERYYMRETETAAPSTVRGG